MITRSIAAGMTGISAAGFKMIWQSEKYKLGWLPPVKFAMVSAAVLPPIFLLFAYARAGKEGSIYQLANQDEVALGMSLGIASIAIDMAAQLAGAAVAGDSHSSLPPTIFGPTRSV